MVSELLLNPYVFAQNCSKSFNCFDTLFAKPNSTSHPKYHSSGSLDLGVCAIKLQKNPADSSKLNKS